MIKYALGCAEGHAFDSWFPDSAGYEKQRKGGFVVCPECGSSRVNKAIMAPAVVGGERSTVEAGPGIVVDDDRRRRTREFFLHMRREIEANTDDVGARFPQVARAIHLGEEPERRGIADAPASLTPRRCWRTGSACCRCPERWRMSSIRAAPVGLTRRHCEDAKAPNEGRLSTEARQGGVLEIVGSPTLGSSLAIPARCF